MLYSNFNDYNYYENWSNGDKEPLVKMKLIFLSYYSVLKAIFGL